MEHEKATVEEMLHRLSPRSTSALGIKRCRWQPGTSVTVSLTGRWLEVEEAQQTFIWEAAYVLLDFDVMLASDAPLGVTVLKFDVAIEGIRVAKLRIDLKVADTRGSERVQDGDKRSGPNRLCILLFPGSPTGTGPSGIGKNQRGTRCIPGLFIVTPR